MRTVDARGQVCPRPLVMTKQALGEAAAGEPLTILIDNPVSRQNVERFLIDNGMVPSCREEAGVAELTVVKRAGELEQPHAASYCGTGERLPHVIVFSSDRMGRGDDDLGEFLIKALVNIIQETVPLPSHLIFYNSGIFLTVEGSTLVGSLRELEEQGVKVLVCGTCVQHYGKTDAVRVGTISNMYDILGTMTAAGHVIKP